jgi:prepilin-type N-terminal cleavage/methylation domain-containing protein
MTRIASRSAQRGFSLAELLVVILLGTIIAAALYQVLVFQQRLYTDERAATYRHDALRLASAVLSADLMEASASEGDFVATETDSLSLRSPVGFGIVCAIDASVGRLAMFDVQGRMDDESGDSLLIYHPDGWLVRDLSEAESEATAGLACPYASGPSVERVVRVAGSLGGVPVGAPVRAFHRYSYRVDEHDGAWWLVRDDGSATQVLAGPFSEEGSGLSFAYFNATGGSTTDPAQVARVDLTLVAESETFGERDTLTASVRPRNQ